MKVPAISTKVWIGLSRHLRVCHNIICMSASTFSRSSGAFISGCFLALCLIPARLGVARPDLDVFFIIIKRPGHEDQEVPGLSLGGVIMQAVSNLGVFPTIALTSPAIFYRPEIGPSPTFLLVTGLAFALLAGLAWLCWRGRITWRAPREQQLEAERELAAEANR